ncbi:MAG: hypothetical protein ACXVB0_16090 [Mucilaginibacter sp.]
MLNYYKVGVSLRAGLCTHTAQALTTGPVPVSIPYANHGYCQNPVTTFTNQEP